MGRYVVTETSLGATPREMTADATSQRAATASGDESVVAGMSSVAMTATNLGVTVTLGSLRPSPSPNPRAVMMKVQQKRAP